MYKQLAPAPKKKFFLNENYLKNNYFLLFSANKLDFFLKKTFFYFTIFSGMFLTSPHRNVIILCLYKAVCQISAHYKIESRFN